MQRFLTILLIVFTALLPEAHSQDPDFFESQVRPLLKQRCGECHGPAVQKSGLRLDARHAAFKGGDGGAVIVAGKSGASELYRRVTTMDLDVRMPPEGTALAHEELELLKRWIDDGAVWLESDYDREAAKDRRLDHWSFQPLRDVSVPQVQINTDAGTLKPNDIDRFVVAKQAPLGLHLNPQADRRTLIRRLTMDLTGLPADPDRIDRFVSSTDPDAWNQLIEELLASPHYGERWAQHWLDVVRYADTHGFEVNTPRDNAWPYRDYVIRAFNDDKPYDQFLREQLAGDTVGVDEATGFLVASAVLLPGQIGADDVSKRQARQDALDEIIVGTSGSMLGLTIGCARCHDHKFDPILQRDYYSMQAFFAGVEYGDRPMRDAGFQHRLTEATALSARISELEVQLQKFEPLAEFGKTLVIDEQQMTSVTYLMAPNGLGANPVGTKPGYKDDVGSASRMSNISGGHYTWWNNVSGEDVMTYNPGVVGKFNLWISWGAHGSGVHTRDARYVLDRDGDVATRDDQSELATVDQYYMANITQGETEQVPLWSGLLAVGAIELSPATKLILRGGDTGTGITADTIVLQEVRSELPQHSLPALRSPVSPLQNSERFSRIVAKFVRFTTHETINNNQHEPCLDELEVYSASNPTKNIGLASLGVTATSSGNYSDIGQHQLKHINDGRYGNDHSWISSQQGGGWVQLELTEPTEIDRVVWGRDREGKFPDRLPVRYEIATSLDGVAWTTVAQSSERIAVGSPFDAVQAILRTPSNVSAGDLQTMASELAGLRARKVELETPQMVFAGTFHEPDMTFLLRRGDPEQRVDEIAPSIPSLFLSPSPVQTVSMNIATKTGDSVNGLTAEQQRRVMLADWIASPANPLTARVMVNRVWQHHFGMAIVDTPSDFGINGTAPSHPELLDWLAGEFIRSGWSVKHLHRLILQSATYRQSAQINPVAEAIDRDNRLLWRYSSHRIEAEAVRDCMLFVSGELNLKMGGRGYNFFQTRGGLDGFPPVEEFTPEEMRRMIYSHKVRMEQVAVFGAFDCPDAGQSMPRRGRSTTAIQALNLFNSPFVNDRATAFAARVAEVASPEIDDQVRTSFRLAVSRAPSNEELAASHHVVKDHGLPMLCRVLFNSSEFLFIP